MKKFSSIQLLLVLQSLSNSLTVQSLSIVPHSSSFHHHQLVCPRRSEGTWLGMSKYNKVSETETENSSQPKLSLSPRKYSYNVTFPTFAELEQLYPGEFVESSIITVPGGACDNDEEDPINFRLLLYPRGGGHSSSTSSNKKDSNGKSDKSGFGMSYKVVPFWKKRSKNDKLGMYLKYICDPKVDSSDRKTVDATFTMRLKGNQDKSAYPRKFDVEWTSGMRFSKETSLNDGYANDFGAHLMQADLLPLFMGITSDRKRGENLKAQVEIQIHNIISDDVSKNANISDSESSQSFSLSSLNPKDDIRIVRDDGTDEILPDVHNAENVRVGKVIVPVLRKLSERPRMFAQGVYPGVEYRIMRITKKNEPDTDSEEEIDIFESEPGVNYDLKPIYPLVQQLEREWPVRINESDISRLVTPTQYNVISAVGSLFTAVTGLFTAFLVSQMISLYFIPSRSMEPTLNVGDVLVVEKVTPRLNNLVQSITSSSTSFYKPGDVILFQPPTKLKEIVESTGGQLNDRDLFVKRIAALPGDSIEVNIQDNTDSDEIAQVKINSIPVQEIQGNRNLCVQNFEKEKQEALPKLLGKFITPTQSTIPKNEYFVMGDCGPVSVDSRAFGFLDQKQIIGKPLFRIW
eukprot:CAMPEP_0178975094 /NCGR_PEP_ID=MMETSP0789-20121207/22917_1 /TAXON_ID=3005 /ORGANISM="Rhizosolenia setigera, Strain CCMP 1694" /LENGTH=630 /DNA_ID=CAMNT_0020663693 /DNA_START=108 /DNA_END=1997 /DNA_ORIENTATION=+